MCDAQRGFRSLKLMKKVVIGVGILIGPLFLKDLFIFSVLIVNNKVLDQKCKDRFLFEDTLELVYRLLHLAGFFRLTGYEWLFGGQGIHRPEVFDIK